MLLLHTRLSSSSSFFGGTLRGRTSELHGERSRWSGLRCCVGGRSTRFVRLASSFVQFLLTCPSPSGRANVDWPVRAVKVSGKCFVFPGKFNNNQPRTGNKEIVWVLFL